jgi:hypothetical protein
MDLTGEDFLREDVIEFLGESRQTICIIDVY